MKLHNGSVARMFSPIMRTPALCKESHGRVATSLGQTTSAVAEHATEAYGLKPTRRTKPNQTKPQANKKQTKKPQPTKKPSLEAAEEILWSYLTETWLWWNTLWTRMLWNNLENWFFQHPTHWGQYRHKRGATTAQSCLKHMSKWLVTV